VLVGLDEERTNRRVGHGASSARPIYAGWKQPCTQHHRMQDEKRQ